MKYIEIDMEIKQIFEARKLVIIFVDMQKDFVNMALGTKEAMEIVPAVVKLNELAKHSENVVRIYTQDTHFEKDGEDENGKKVVAYANSLEGKMLPVVHCIRGTEGWGIIPELDTTGATIVEKHTFGYTGWKKNFDDVLSDADAIILTGLCTDICVAANAELLRAEYPNKRIIVIKDATAGVTPALKESALVVLQSCQMEIL